MTKLFFLETLKKLRHKIYTPIMRLEDQQLVHKIKCTVMPKNRVLRIVSSLIFSLFLFSSCAKSVSPQMAAAHHYKRCLSVR
jgi:hypothetical protein